MSQPLNSLRQDDKARRAYALSMDWLQLFCHTTSYFNPDETSPWGYRLVRKDYGSKFWQRIYDVYDPDGVLFGQLATTPHRKDINQSSCMLKVENSILYEADALDRADAAIDGMGLKYKGISRIDVAYDCNELYNGLSVQNLIMRYLYGADGKRYLKCGQNKALVWMDMCYHGRETADGSMSMHEAAPRRTKKQQEADRQRFEEQKEECEKAGLPAPEAYSARRLSGIPDAQVGSITWGVRSQSVQVQIKSCVRSK